MSRRSPVKRAVKTRVRKKSTSPGRRARTRTIRQSATFDGPPIRVYEILMTSEGHSELTGSKARISPVVGGKIDVWDGYITGENVELVPGVRIVQRVRFAEEGWPDGHGSLMTVLLGPGPGGGTRLKLTHED
ncbi:MAG TPA: SRPBCC domain-containing protein, partial [Thermoplasmata archaeon]|nr:SRPBCC domain-containing protein [Thermoplasmata archaeon]